MSKSVVYCEEREAIYLREKSKDINFPFYEDADKIISSNSYTRYMDKTQVFPRLYVPNDHIATRKIHIELTNRVGRKIGRNLGLNEDLIEAIALGHDVGHTPFGHEGERALSKITEKVGLGYFTHNAHSVRNLMYLENNGEGLNVSLQVLDGILCHNGEETERQYIPDFAKTKEQFLTEYQRNFQEKNALRTLHSMTLEGEVVRVSDPISYIGRDIDDCTRASNISWDDIPGDIKRVLGSSTEAIVDTLIDDISCNSYGKPYLELSEKVSEAFKSLLNYNMSHIYLSKLSSNQIAYLDFMFQTLFDIYMTDLVSRNPDSNITKYLNGMTRTYREENSNERIAVDYIAGMTDTFFQNEFDKAMTRVRK